MTIDVALIGLGFTGRLVARELLRVANRGLRIAFVGRSNERLQTACNDLPAAPHLPSPELVVVEDIDDVDDLTQRSKLVLSAAGPFLLTGEPIVSSCVRNRAHYVGTYLHAERTRCLPGGPWLNYSRRY